MYVLYLATLIINI